MEKQFLKGGCMNKYYVLSRWDTPGEMEYQIVSAQEQNPLYGHGSWDLFAGPFTSWENAEAAVPKEVEAI